MIPSTKVVKDVVALCRGTSSLQRLEKFTMCCQSLMIIYSIAKVSGAVSLYCGREDMKTLYQEKDVFT